VLINIDIKDGKIWLQYNGTETPIAERLVEMGVPAHDIVLGFHSEFKRQFSKYAMN
jgi:XisI protein